MHEEPTDRQPTRTSLYYPTLILSILITFTIYGRSLFLPFFFDDLILLPYVSETPLAQFWRAPAIFPYYRPVALSVWRLSYLLWGSHNPIWLHGLNLTLHAINGWLVGILAVKLFVKTQTKSSTYILLASSSTILYLLFPFHFQAVPWITAAFHLLVTTFILGSLFAYLQFRQTNQWRWVVIGVILALVAPFTQESGVLIGALVLTAELTHKGKHNWRATALWFTPLFIWLPIWLIVPRAASEGTVNMPETVMQNLVWFLQGMAFPTTWAGGWIRDNWGWDGFWTAVFLSTTTLISGGILLHRTRTQFNSRRLWFVAAFGLLTSLPALLLLPFAYLLSSPRLMTVTAVSTAWFWALIITVGIESSLRYVPNQQKKRWIWVGSTGILILLLIIPAASFLQRQMRAHTWLGSVYDQMTAHTITANAAERAAIAINFPYEIGVHQPTFGIGHEGVVFTVSYIPIANIISTQTGETANFNVFHRQDIRPQMSYLYGVMGGEEHWPDLLAQTPNPQIFNSSFSEDGIVIQETGMDAPLMEETTPLAIFSGEIILQAGWVTAVNNQLRLDTIWEIKQPPPHEVTLFAHALSESGQLVTQADGYAWGRTHPMEEWLPNTYIQDTRYLNTIDNSIHIQIGLYHSTTGERLPATTADGQPIPNNSINIDQQEP